MMDGTNFWERMRFRMTTRPIHKFIINKTWERRNTYVEEASMYVLPFLSHAIPQRRGPA
jgi:hypothetical protein